MNFSLTIRRSFCLPAGATLAILLSACDSAPAELVDEINAAREGCTEEMLKLGDEACVRMFEKYAEMGADAMETYIGGMRAFDEAIQRRGGIQFDTTGLGRAFTPGVAASEAGAAADPFATRVGSGEIDGAFDSVEWPAGEPAGRWADMPVEGASEFGAAPSSAVSAARRAPVPSGRAPSGRGTLLPPDERLRRPWIDDEPAAEPSAEEQPATSGARPRPLPEAGAWGGAPGAGSGGGGWNADPRNDPFGRGWGADPRNDPTGSGWGADPRNDPYRSGWE